MGIFEMKWLKPQHFPHSQQYPHFDYKFYFEENLNTILEKEKYTNKEYFNHKRNGCNCPLIKPNELKQYDNIDIIIKHVSGILLNYLYKDVINICTEYIGEDYIKSCVGTPLLIEYYCGSIIKDHFFGKNTLPGLLNECDNGNFFYVNCISRYHHTISLFVSPEYTQDEKLILQHFTINTIVCHTESDLWYQIDGISQLFNFIRLKKPEKKLDYNKFSGKNTIYITFKQAIKILELEQDFKNRNSRQNKIKNRLQQKLLAKKLKK